MVLGVSRQDHDDDDDSDNDDDESWHEYALLH